MKPVKIKRYDHQKVERRWQKVWEAKKLNCANERSRKKKFYALVEFPYPSGEGLHVGHIRSYTAMDVVARKRRAEGYEVLYPMGWDAFGLPTENYAIKTGLPPQLITKKNTNRYRQQLQALGFSFDWSREINTTDPEYYKWTQWMFLQFYKKGLAYKAKVAINWCPKDKIGLANEEVIDSKCERCGAAVEKREKEQWMLAITKYADRLARELDLVDYPESIKTQQRNWIGKSEGAEIEFKISNPTPDPLPEGEGVKEGEFGYQTTDPKTWRLLQDRALAMRQNPTAAENILWQALRDNSTGCHFRRQHIIGKFIVDFACLERKIIVEVDGDIHDYQKSEDAERSAFLEASGYTVVRFKNDEVIKNSESVKAKIITALKALSLGEGLGGVDGGVIKIFTTRPETIFGVTFVAVAGPADCFTGRYVINPATQEKVPVWEAEYVMGEVGTGAIMGVPAHDERDFEFAKKHSLPITEVVIPIEGEPHEGAEFRRTVSSIVYRKSDGKFLALKWKKFNWLSVPIGGIENNESPEATAEREVFEETGYQVKAIRKLGGQIESHFFAENKNVWRARLDQPVLLEVVDDKPQEVSLEEKEKHEAIWMSGAELVSKMTHKYNAIGLERYLSANDAYVGGGRLTNSAEFSGMDSAEAAKQIINKFGMTKTTYKLRDWIFSRQRYWGEPIPLIFCEKDGWQPVAEKDLPVKLPTVKKYQPTDNGESPLAVMEKWVKTKCPTCDGPARRETDTMPNWAGSSWYYLRYIDPKNKKTFADYKKLARWSPVDWYNGGMEHTTLHLLYSRFWHKILNDLKLVPGKEPYQKRTAQGMILATDGEKMSKSRGNVINPDDIVQRFGADTIRVYEMFMGPFDQAITWSEDGLVGSRRFLERVWRMVEKVGRVKGTNPELETKLHQTIQKVSADIEAMKFNTGISALMVLLNDFEAAEIVPVNYFKIFLKLLSPFAPHLTDELWNNLGEKHSIHLAPWPRADKNKLTRESTTIVVQINGRLRDSLILPADSSEEVVTNAARASTKIKIWLDGKTIQKTIFIPNRLINFVVDNS